MPEEQILGLGMTALRDAASFAVCANPLLVGRSARETDARAVVVQLGRRAGFRSIDLAAFLGVTPEAIRQLGRRGVDEDVLTATLLRLAIVASMGGRPKLSGR